MNKVEEVIMFLGVLTTCILVGMTAYWLDNLRSKCGMGPYR